MTPTVMIYSDQQLRTRRDEIIAHLGMSEAELRRNAAVYMLTAQQESDLDELDRIDFLLGD